MFGVGCLFTANNFLAIMHSVTAVKLIFHPLTHTHMLCIYTCSQELLSDPLYCIPYTHCRNVDNASTLLYTYIYTCTYCYINVICIDIYSVYTGIHIVPGFLKCISLYTRENGQPVRRHNPECVLHAVHV